MPFYWIIHSIRKFRMEFLESVFGLLDRDAIEKAFEGFTVRKRTYSTWPILVMFLSQVAMRNSCRKEVADAISNRLVPRRTDQGTSAYCNARNRLPEEPLRELVWQYGEALAGKARKGELFFGRRVKVVDGTSVQLPDTEANQAEYPQPAGQKPGCGNPVMYISVLMDLATGAILRALTSGGSGYERKLFREMWPTLEKGDIVLGDRNYGSYAEIAMLSELGVDGVFRWNDTRKHRMDGVVRLGKDDWLETWERPANPGDWIDCDGLPKTIKVRVVRFNCQVKGSRSKEIKLVTTLTDPKRHPKEELARLYARRWEMELRFDDIKTAMELQLLKCKAPDRCRKELWMGLLAYNMIRTVMLHAARRRNMDICKISFAGTRDRLEAFSSGPFAWEDPKEYYRLLLDNIAEDDLPYRPGRYEPHAVKRRWTRHVLLTKSRHAARHALLGA